MTALPRDPKGLLDAIAGTVRLELDRVLVGQDAPLVVPDSERWTVTAVLSGRVKHDSLPCLEGRHFAIGAFGALWEASRETLEPAALHMAVTGAGFPSVSTDIAEMCDYGDPLPSLIDLASMCTRIRDYWARRLLHAELVSCARLLAAEGLTVEGVFDRLRPIAREIRS